MNITHATKRIQQPTKMHVPYVAKHQFGHCCRGLKLGHGCVLRNLPRDDINDIDGFSVGGGWWKHIILICYLRIWIYLVPFLMSLSIFC